jgi:hypothetical protein
VHESSPYELKVVSRILPEIRLLAYSKYQENLVTIMGMVYETERKTMYVLKKLWRQIEDGKVILGFVSLIAVAL